MGTKNKANELHITRIYDAPLKAVWDAWTDPKQVAQWWGPRGFTITHHSKDLRPGGIWHYTMHGPDGVDYANKTVYHEVEPYSLLVYDHGGYDERAPLFRVTVTFEETKGKTKMDMIMAMPSAEALEQTKKVIKNAGGNSTWDRLAEYLEKESTGREMFVINRTFNVSLDVMSEMWTNPKHVSQWLPPTGFTMEFVHSDIRPGGSSFYFMTNGTGVKMYGGADYKELSKTRVVYTQQFRDENNKVSRHPMSPTWPETMLTTVTLAEEGPNQTRVTIEWQPYGNVTAEEMATFVKGRSGMTQGWTGSFDKLEEYAATAKI